MKICVFTLGCKTNRYESDCIINALRQKGFEVTDSLQPCDKYIINTCAVTKEAERKSRQVLSKIKKLNARAQIYVIGCASQYNPKAFAEKGIKYISGTEGKTDIVNMLSGEGINISPFSGEYCDYFAFAKGAAPLKTRAFIKIQDGCDSYCSYCIIPSLRGRSRSRSMQSIKEEILSLSSAKEFVLTGINISDYGKKEGGLSGLLEYLSDIDARIRLGSLENGVIGEGLILAAKKMKNFCPHFHLSLQSGSDKVLKDMNRHYTAQDYLQSVELIRRHFPDAAITTDVICGYPTESEEDFNKTVEICSAARFADIHVFVYSKREGTRAAGLPALDKNITDERAQILKELKLKLKDDFARQNFGKTRLLLAESFEGGYTSGYTENYLKAYVKGKIEPNNIYTVKIGGAYGDGALAEII